MDYRVLGSLDVRNSEGSIALGCPKQRALLALLLLNANQPVSRDRLIDDLWGEEPPETAVQSVHVYVSRLRNSDRLTRSLRSRAATSSRSARTSST
jgi:DNA-binding SARP family transcriptional activator